ncbi:Cro/Cl family transcriptional regulator [Alkalilimnicola ehrlichii]|uniref:Cro/Cl family transcriptional regulator n=2 Tax=Alkalilimnicola ehrlichii TaxID=351052 RepID=A0A3E0WI62_9GAMM|nr:Cro/Cl family transcriptional regulator [Alkalilimnicola ehrlichii]RFA31851.1 Cro/Cl family transcriptional regulator [Alkalilimnicola ehrlichii]
MDKFLANTPVVDWTAPAVREQAHALAGKAQDPAFVAEQCFRWVRDEVDHSVDVQRPEVTCKASEVLAERVGLCYAKSHLLAALLRANGIAAGFCYQRVRMDGPDSNWCLHGLNALYLNEYGWYRVDARGNKAGIYAEFCPPAERLAYAPVAGEVEDVPGVFAEPMPVVVEALSRYDSLEQLLNHLPDLNV